MRAFLSLICCFSAHSVAQNIAGTNWSLNPAHKFSQTTANNFKSEDGLELTIKVSHFESETAARSMGRIEFTNIEKLYGARKNPYQGQVSDIVKCDPELKPRQFFFKFQEQDIRVLLVGANSRRALGSCVKDQLSYWVSYFNFYDPPSKSVLEFRLFTKVDKATQATIDKLSAKLEPIAKTLVVPEK